MFKLPKKIENDFREFEPKIEDFKSGKISAGQFALERVPWGIYSQRGTDTFMARVRIPAGYMSPAQLGEIAFVAAKYGSGTAHITTRQDIQLHGVKIEDAAKIIKHIKDYDLSPRGGGGNAVRNIIACPLAGICKDEVFDVKTYAAGLTEYLLDQESSYALPRKFKVAFSGCGRDCAGCLVNDVGLLARSVKGKTGFRVFVGGGMGTESILGHLLEDFILADDLGCCVEAIKQVFNTNGDRKNRHRNRLRFLVKNIGFEKFKLLYHEQYKELKNGPPLNLRKIDLPEKTEGDDKIPAGKSKGYDEFIKYNVCSQRQRGYSSVKLRIPLGEISAAALARLAGLEDKFSGIDFRATQDQDLLVCWVKKKDISAIYDSVGEILKDFLYPSTILDPVCCKGALTCNLGLCNSQGLAKAVGELIKNNFIGTKVFEKLDIKINGCPNACGHHPIGRISFHGMVKRFDNRPVPYYKLLIGGLKKAGDTRFAKEVGAIPAKNIPDFLKKFLNRVETDFVGKDIDNYLTGRGIKLAGEILKDYRHVPPHSENKDYYIDWGKTEEFSLDGIGPGQCSLGGVRS